MKKLRRCAGVIIAVSLFVTGCGNDGPEEHGGKYRAYLEEQSRANGYSGNIDTAVRARIDAYKSADKEKQKQMMKEIE